MVRTENTRFCGSIKDVIRHYISKFDGNPVVVNKAIVGGIYFFRVNLLHP